MPAAVGRLPGLGLGRHERAVSRPRFGDAILRAARLEPPEPLGSRGGRVAAWRAVDCRSRDPRGRAAAASAVRTDHRVVDSATARRRTRYRQPSADTGRAIRRAARDCLRSTGAAARCGSSATALEPAIRSGTRSAIPLPMPGLRGRGRLRKNAKPPIPLRIATAMGVAERQPGTGARIDKRLLVFGSLSLTRERRRPGHTQAWEPTLHKLACVLWPDGEGGTNYRPDRHRQRLTRQWMR